MVRLDRKGREDARSFGGPPVCVFHCLDLGGNFVGRFFTHMKFNKNAVRMQEYLWVCEEMIELSGRFFDRVVVATQSFFL